MHKLIVYYCIQKNNLLSKSFVATLKYLIGKDPDTGEEAFEKRLFLPYLYTLKFQTLYLYEFLFIICHYPEGSHTLDQEEKG